MYIICALIIYYNNVMHYISNNYVNIPIMKCFLLYVNVTISFTGFENVPFSLFLPPNVVQAVQFIGRNWTKYMYPLFLPPCCISRTLEKDKYTRNLIANINMYCIHCTLYCSFPWARFRLSVDESLQLGKSELMIQVYNILIKAHFT